MKKLRNISLILLVLLWVGCEADIQRPAPATGEADFSVMVTLGNSLTAGFGDGDLYRSSQESSFAALMAQQMKQLGLQEFNQPLMHDEYGLGYRLVLGVNAGGLAPMPAGVAHSPLNEEPLPKIPYHNLGVPGARAAHLLAPGMGQLNPYFYRFAINPITSSVVSDAMSLSPTFFTLWIGNNDILGYATSGGAGGASSAITPAAEYDLYLKLILDQLTSAGAKGAIANIPPILETPFFRTVPFNGLVLNQAQADALNAAYAQLPTVNFAPGANGFVVADAASPGGMRQLQAGELMLLTVPQDKIRNEGWGSQVPIPEQYYLSLAQIQQIQAAVNQYNQVIAAVATQYQLAHVDVYALMQQIKTGMHIEGLFFSAEYVTGGIFSLDGVHLSKRANAVVANTFIDAINDRFGSTIPRVAVADQEGMEFP